MIKLDVPHRSQIERTASYAHADCGPACALMVAHAYRHATNVTVDEIYTRHGAVRKDGSRYGLRQGPLAVNTIADVLRGLGIPPTRLDGVSYSRIIVGLAHLMPMIALVDYSMITNAGLSKYRYYGGHFVVIVGGDDDHLLIHDPYYPPQEGAYIRWPRGIFERSFDQLGTQYRRIVIAAPPLTERRKAQESY